MQLASVDMSAGKREAITRRPAPNPNSIIATPPHSFESKSQIMQKHKKAVIIAEASEKVSDDPKRPKQLVVSLRSFLN